MPRPARRGQPPAASPSIRQQSLQRALAAFQESRLADCMALCEAILSKRPEEAAALHLLGAARLRSGDAKGAVPPLARAAELDPRNAELHANLGAALRAAGDPARARQTLERALTLKPDHVPALINLGNAANDSGQHEAAAEHYGRALALHPGHPGALANLGHALAAAGNAAEAAEAYRGALAAAPAHPEALTGLARLLRDRREWQESLTHYDAALASTPGNAGLHNERGVILLELERAEEAIEAFRAALSHDPALYDAQVNLGSAICMAGRPEEGAAVLEAAMAERPDDADALSNLGAAFSDAGLTERALAVLERASMLDPRHVDALVNLGKTLYFAERFEDAIGIFDRALAIVPAHPEGRYGRANADLATGRFRQGWEDYRARPSVAGTTVFDGTSLPRSAAGRHVLIERDQGLGDEIFFLRFVPGLKDRQVRVTYRPDGRLVNMLRRSGLPVDVLRPEETPDAADYRIAVSDLPWFLGHREDTSLPATIALPPIPARVVELRRRLDSFGPPPWLGLTWRGGTRGRRKALFKEAPWKSLAAALKGTAGTWIALQRLPEEGEIAAIADRLEAPLHDLTSLNDDLEGMLALLSLLDEYICVSNTNVHLRAACGLASRVLVPSPPEFRWMAEGAESPWFPGTPVYRQTAAGAWDEAFAALAADLRAAPVRLDMAHPMRQKVDRKESP